MSNEEKSTQVAIEFSSVFPSANSTTVYDLVLAMAEWKDAQFKKYIEAHKQPVLASETDDTIVGYSIDADMLIEWLKSDKG